MSEFKPYPPEAAAETELVFSDEWKYGPIGKAYPQEFRDQIEEKIASIQAIKDPEKRKAIYEQREKFWENFTKFIGHFEQISQENRTLGVVEAMELALEKVNPYEKRFRGLDDHLDEISTEGTPFFTGLENAARRKAERDGMVPPQDPLRKLLSRQQRLLLTEFIAPIHDTFKYMGSPDAQTLSDHEVMSKFFINGYIKPGRSLLTIPNPRARAVEAGLAINQQDQAPGFDRRIRLFKDDIQFAANVAGNHENIRDPKKWDRVSYIISKNAEERAKSIFFLWDVLTKVLIVHEDGKVSLDPEALKTRFLDLYDRHIAHPKHPAAKAFTPVWGVMALNDIDYTLRILVEDYGITLEPVQTPQGEVPLMAYIGQGMLDVAYKKMDMGWEPEDFPDLTPEEVRKRRESLFWPIEQFKRVANGRMMRFDNLSSSM